MLAFHHEGNEIKYLAGTTFFIAPATAKRTVALRGTEDLVKLIAKIPFLKLSEMLETTSQSA